MVKKRGVDPADAFELYFALGSDRSLVKLHENCTKIAPQGEKVPSLRTLKEWSRKYHWQERCAIRDAEVTRKVEQISTSSVINLKAQLLAQVRAVIDTAFANGMPKISCSRPRDLRDLIEVALKLLGEPEREEVAVHINIAKLDEPDDKES